eukprot:5395430-Prymnesium_polylepis.1
MYFSALPPGLTKGVDALAMPPKDNWAYAGVTTGTPTELREAIAQIASTWTSSNIDPQAIPTRFTIFPEVPPSRPPSPSPPPSPPP